MFKNVALLVAGALSAALLAPGTAAASEVEANRADRAIDRALQVMGTEQLTGEAASHNLADGVEVGAVTISAPAARGRYLQVDNRGIIQTGDGVAFAVEGDRDAVRISAVIPDAGAHTQTYSLDLPANGRLVRGPEGTVSVELPGGATASTIDAPWAVDANGKKLPTRYEIHGSTLAQVTDLSAAAYPVVADPRIRLCRVWLFIPGVCYTYTPLRETFDLNHKIQHSDDEWTLAMTICAATGNPAGVAVCLYLANKYRGYIKEKSQNIADRQQCIQIRLPLSAVPIPANRLIREVRC